MAKDTNKEDSSKLTKEEIRAAKAKIEAEKEYSHSLSYANVELRKAIGYLKDQSKSLDGLLRSSKALNDSTKQNAELKQDLASMYTKELQDASTLLLKRNMISTGLKGDYAQYITQYEIQHKGNAEMMKRVPALIEELKHRQHVNDETNKQTELYEEMGRKLAEIKEETEEWKHSLTKVFETAKAIGRDPKVFGAFMLTQMVEKAELLHKGFEDLSTSGLTVGQRVQSMAKGFSLMSMLGLSDTKGVLAGMVEQMGTMNSLTSAEVDHVGHLAKEMGVTGQEAFGLVEGFSKLPGETMATATHAADYVKSLSEANGVAPGKITKEIAKNTELMALGGYKSAKAFTDAAMKAQKMGVELSTSKNVMNGLLNFEDSLNAQMEASVLLGKEINLDKARELALNGKSVEATAEVLKNIGGQAEFEKMNVKQKEALAKASGMSVEELSKALDAQKELNKYSGEAASPFQKMVGTIAEVGGGVVGLAKEYGMMALSLIQAGIQYSTMLALKGASITATATETSATSGNIIMTKLSAAASGAWNMIKGIGITIANSAIVTWMAEKAAIVGNYIATGASTVATGAWNAIKFISNALGITAIGTWIAETAAKLANVGATSAAAAATGTLAAVQETAAVASVGASGGIVSFGAALGAFGTAAAPAIPIILALGLALLMATPAIYVIGEVIKSLATVIGNVLMKALEMLPSIIGAVVAGFQVIFGLLVANWKILIPVGFGMVALAAGVSALGAAFLFAFPGLMMGALAMTAMAIPIAVIGASLQYIASSADGLSLVGAAMLNIGSGLGAMAVNGLAAMPVIGALMALAAVAPALSGLGSVLGGAGGGEKKEDKMQVIADKLDQLITIASKGGVINMDGKKVGDIIRTSINSSGVR